MPVSEFLSLINNLLAKFGADPGILATKEYVLNLESAYAECIKEKAELMEKIIGYANWDKDKVGYEICEGSVKNFYYRKKGTEELFCPNCFESKQHAIHLQPALHRADRMQGVLNCPNCKTQLVK